MGEVVLGIEEGRKGGEEGEREERRKGGMEGEGEGTGVGGFEE